MKVQQSQKRICCLILFSAVCINLEWFNNVGGIHISDAY